MGKRLNLTFSTGIVLQAVAQGHRYGFDVMDVSGLADGTVYPALRRLERAKMLVSDWEDAREATREKRPPRRYYQLTEAGREMLAQARARFPGLVAAVPSAAQVEGA